MSQLLQIESVASLTAALKADDRKQRRRAAQALAEIGPDAFEAVDGLVEALSDRDWEVRSYARTALSLVGRRAVPSLLGALSDPEWYVRYGCVVALCKMGPEAFAAVSCLITVLRQDPHVFVRAECAKILAELGVREAIPFLIEAFERDLSDYDSEYARCTAADALGKFGPLAWMAVGVLERVLYQADVHEAVRRSAAEALKRIRD